MKIFVPILLICFCCSFGLADKKTWSFREFFQGEWTVHVSRDPVSSFGKDVAEKDTEEDIGHVAHDPTEMTLAHYDFKLEGEKLIGNYYENTTNSHESKNHMQIQLEFDTAVSGVYKAGRAKSSLFGGEDGEEIKMVPLFEFNFIERGQGGIYMSKGPWLGKYKGTYHFSVILPRTFVLTVIPASNEGDVLTYTAYKENQAGFLQRWGPTALIMLLFVAIKMFQARGKMRASRSRRAPTAAAKPAASTETKTD